MTNFYRSLWVIGGFSFLLSSLLISIFEASVSFFFLPYYYILFSLALFIVSRVKSKYEIVGFFFYFSINLFWIGVSVLFRNQFQDYSQNQADAFFFYETSLKSFSDTKLQELVLTTEGSFAIYSWRKLYECFSFLGFKKSPTIGIVFNAWILAIGCLISVKIAKLIYNDKYKILRFIVFYSLCAIYWLFGSVHIRDSFIVLFVIIQLYFAISYLKNKTKARVILFGLVSLTGIFSFPFLRTEFYFIPILFFLAAISIPLLLKVNNKKRIIYSFFLILLIGLLFSYLFSDYINIVFKVLESGQKGYIEEVSETASDNSLGVKIIINQPIALRLILGSVYLHIYPIPFWYGFKTDTIYDLFKSLNLFYLWFILPLVYMSVRKCKSYNQVEKETILFCISVYIVLLLAIAGTSLETRHLAVFFVPLILIAVKPDLRNKFIRKEYKVLLLNLFFFVFIIHIAWVFLKYVL